MVRKGFTLIELVVVVLIIGILATLGLTQYAKTVEKARGTEAKQVIGFLRTTCAQEYMEKGSTDGCALATFNSNTAPRAEDLRYFWYYTLTAANSSEGLKIEAKRCKTAATCKAVFKGDVAASGTVTYEIDYNTSWEKWTNPGNY